MSPLPPFRSRHTPRLEGYDYSQSGMYFVTIVTAKRECLFGEIRNGAMGCNQFGDMVVEDWSNLPEHFNGLVVADFVVMPNHFHGILILADTDHSLSTVIGSFKAGLTRRINIIREMLGAFIWQRSFHDRIIRDEAELIRIQAYIDANPLKWDLDSENPTNGKTRT